MWPEPTRAKPPPSAVSGGISMGHQCCAIATAAALTIDPDRRCHVLVTEWGCAWGRGKPLPWAIMGNVVNDFLLFSCMALFVTGIVLAAASLLI